MAGGPLLAVIGAALAGFADGLLTTALFLVRNRDAPARARAQVFTVGSSLRSAGYAAAAATLAPLAGHAAATLWVGAGLQLAAITAGLIGLGHRGLGHRGLGHRGHSQEPDQMSP